MRNWFVFVFVFVALPAEAARHCEAFVFEHCEDDGCQLYEVPSRLCWDDPELPPDPFGTSEVPTPMEAWRQAGHVDLDDYLTPPQWAKGDCLLEPSIVGCADLEWNFPGGVEPDWIEVTAHYSYVRSFVGTYVAEAWCDAHFEGKDWWCMKIYSSGQDWGTGCTSYPAKTGTWSWHSDRNRP